MTAQEAARIISIVRSLWPTVPFQAEVNADLVTAWQVVLSDVPFDAAQAFLADLSRGGAHFPPAPGELANAVLLAVARAEGRAAPDADQAWAEVEAAVSSRGWYAGPPDAWSHPAVAAGVQALGWGELCHGESMINRAHFMKLYPTVQARTEGDRRLAETLTALGAGTVKRLELDEPNPPTRSQLNPVPPLG